MPKMMSCIVMCLCLLASGLSAQTVELSTRTFWVGEQLRTMDSETPFISVREIRWIEAVLGTDPVLQDAVVHIELTYMSVKEAVAKPDESDVLLGPDRLRQQYKLSDYRIFGPTALTARSFTYLPVDPAAGYDVWCSERDDVAHMSLCVVRATYVPDDRIRLKARLYFPPDPVDRPTYFRAVAQRMREVAHCLDVTDEIRTGPVPQPDLSTCKLEPIS